MGEAIGGEFDGSGVEATGGIACGEFAIGEVTGVLAAGVVGTHPPVGHSQLSPWKPLLQLQRHRETQGPELADTQ